MKLTQKMFAEYIKDRFPRRGCGHILGLFKQLIQDYVCPPRLYKNFRRFRNRILHIFSHMQQNKEQAAAY